jgi:hypothetical protein
VLGKHPEDWWLIQPIMPSDRTERLDYPTQKPIELIQRIVDSSSLPDSLVLDAFCGSGTTLAVAEGLRVKREIVGGKARLRYYHVEPRRWIGVDIGRFAIHTSRKRLIELQRARHQQGAAYRSFVVHEFAAGERRQWHRKFAGADGKGYRRAILAAFGAEPNGDPHCDRLAFGGKKEGIPCHVCDMNSVFTRVMAEDVLRLLAAERVDRCYCLAWEFAINLPANIEDLERKHGARLRLVQIPREIMDVPARRAPWFQAGVLKVEPVLFAAPQGKAVDIRVNGFLREAANAAFDAADAQESSAADNGMNLIDFWAVDFDWRADKPFNQHWQSYRSRKKPDVEMVSNARFLYEGPGNHTIAVKVIDTFGFETVATLNVVST